jgi:4-alpha-glucanotransferase
MRKRASGVLLHITALPSKYEIGDFGPEAYRFADFLMRAKQRYWQVLPFCPISSEATGNPYNGLSVFAGNTGFISPELLYQQGLLSKGQIQNMPDFPANVNYRLALSYKSKLLNYAFERFRSTPKKAAFRRFCDANKGWLEDYAIFIALRRHFWPSLWCDWPVEIRDRKKKALEAVKVQFRDAIEREKFCQYVFFSQWAELKRYCNRQGVRIIGDVPIYVAYNSADVWAHPEFFSLTGAKRPRFVSGVPPDKFSSTGQLWGNPVYNWKALGKKGYQWWIERIEHNLKFFDLVRIDHFRGFNAYWQVPAGSKTAAGGKWVRGPREAFFNELFKHVRRTSIIAEDLGYITDDVRKLISKFNLTSMKVLLFAFDGDSAKNLHWPRNHVKNAVVYTGTHDTNTVRGWLRKEAGASQKKRLFDCLGHTVSAGQVSWEMIKLAMSSIADITIVPMQDVLNLGEEARMNHPGTVVGNWSWQLERKQIKFSIVRRLARITMKYGRS